MERGLSEIEFSQKIECSMDDVTRLLQGRMPISIGVARKLSIALGASVEFWMSRDFQYRQDIARIYKADEQWLSELPINDMVKFGWLHPAPRAPEEMRACLRYFDVSSVGEWRKRYADINRFAAFKTSRSLDSTLAAVAAWLRQGEIEASSIDCKTWDAGKLKANVARFRSLTKLKNPERFLPAIQQIGAECGVAIVLVRAPSGCRVSGAVRFLGKSKAVIQLSFRYLVDDQFWFALFHEIGHLLLHELAGTVIEEDGIESDQEREANEFAAKVVIPRKHEDAFLRLRANARDVIRFAVRVGVSAGLVVGQLQHRGRIGFDQLNSLKRRYQWSTQDT